MFNCVYLATYKHETIGNEENKELLAEIVFPIALDLYNSNYAPKLTGMIIDAFENLRNQEQYNQILSSREILIDLVRIKCFIEWTQLNGSVLSIVFFSFHCF